MYVLQRTDLQSCPDESHSSPAGSFEFIGAPELVPSTRSPMNPNYVRITTTAARALAAGMFVAAFTFGAGSALAAHVNAADRTEMRIKDMHAKLKITPEQEDQWQL